MIWTQMLNPALVLGQSNMAVEVKQKQILEDDLLHDIKMTYYCDNTWDVRATLHPTVYAKPKDTDVDQYSLRWVKHEKDPITCQQNNTKEPMDKMH